jgi:hypothetical protein
MNNDDYFSEMTDPIQRYLAPDEFCEPLVIFQMRLESLQRYWRMLYLALEQHPEKMKSIPKYLTESEYADQALYDWHSDAVAEDNANFVRFAAHSLYANCVEILNKLTPDTLMVSDLPKPEEIAINDLVDADVYADYLFTSLVCCVQNLEKTGAFAS